MKHTPHIDRTFIWDKNDSVESISWFNERLFTCGLGGSVIELSLSTLQPLVIEIISLIDSTIRCLDNRILINFQHDLPVTSGSCWCIDINRKDSLIAVS